MVPEVLADPRQVVRGLDAERAQPLAVPDPGDLQELG